MSKPSRSISSGSQKLRWLCAKSAERGGHLISFQAVAAALDLSPTRVSQLFGANKAETNYNISLNSLANLARIFTDAGIELSLEDFSLEYDTFVNVVSKRADLLKSSRATSGWDDTKSALPSAEWTPARPVAHTAIATAQLHPPRPLNSRPNCHYLDVSVRFGTAEHSIGRDTVLIGVRQARLSFDSHSYQIAHMSLIGDAARPMECVMVTGMGVTISAHEDEKLLVGNPLGEHHFAIIEPLESDLGDTSVTINLHASKRGFDFELIRDDGVVSEAPTFTKDALVNLIYGENLGPLRDLESGLHLLATATIHRKSGT